MDKSSCNLNIHPLKTVQEEEKNKFYMSFWLQFSKFIIGIFTNEILSMDNCNDL